MKIRADSWLFSYERRFWHTTNRRPVCRGGFVNSNSQMEMSNVTVAYNGAGTITGGFAITETFNLISGTAGVSPVSPFLIDPGPGPDQDWGTADDDLGDLRLEENSQATDAGSNDFILEDAPDLDGDGNVAEPLPLDLGDLPRVYSGMVDMGAYEWNLFFLYTPLVKK